MALPQKSWNATNYQLINHFPYGWSTNLIKSPCPLTSFLKHCRVSPIPATCWFSAFPPWSLPSKHHLPIGSWYPSANPGNRKRSRICVGIVAFKAHFVCELLLNCQYLPSNLESLGKIRAWSLVKNSIHICSPRHIKLHPQTFIAHNQSNMFLFLFL